jgi:hypothetical protein
MNARRTLLPALLSCCKPVRKGEDGPVPEALRELLFGDEAAFKWFDMREYAEPSAGERLIGAPPSYVGHEQGGRCLWRP